MQVITSLLVLFVACARATQGQQTLVHSWVKVAYDWPNDTVRENYASSQKFIVENNIIAGIKVYKEKVYVTVPRWRPGVPSTLNRVVIKGGNAVLQPYPSWEYQTLGDCQALQYVQSMEIDPNTGFMWIIDNGRVDILDDRPKDLCPPKLVIYDIENNRQVHSHTFPAEVADPTSCYLNDIVLQYVGDRVKFAYVTDTHDAKLYVYNHDEDRSYFFQHRSMLAETSGGTPIDGIAMSADFNFLYYCPIDGLGLFQVPTSVLNNPHATFGDHVRRVGSRLDRTDGLSYGQRSLFYGLLTLNGVQRWDAATDAESTSFDHVTMTTQQGLTHDDVRMRWVDTFAWDNKGYLWFLANDLSRFLNRRMDFTGTSGPNIYIWKVFVNESSYLDRSFTAPNLIG